MTFKQQLKTQKRAKSEEPEGEKENCLVKLRRLSFDVNVLQCKERQHEEFRIRQREIRIGKRKSPEVSEISKIIKKLQL